MATKRELGNPRQEDAQVQMELLKSHRQTLMHYLSQQAILGKAHAPPEVTAGIKNARENIDRIKTTLRGWGVAVEDHPDDEEIKLQTSLRQTHRHLQNACIDASTIFM